MGLVESKNCWQRNLKKIGKQDSPMDLHSKTFSIFSSHWPNSAFCRHHALCFLVQVLERKNLIGWLCQMFIWDPISYDLRVVSCRTNMAVRSYPVDRMDISGEVRSSGIVESCHTSSVGASRCSPCPGTSLPWPSPSPPHLFPICPTADLISHLSICIAQDKLFTFLSLSLLLSEMEMKIIPIL